MIDLTNGEPMKWINDETGGWETGTAVLDEGAYIPHRDGESILIAKTFGGLCFVEWSRLERVQMRSEWEATA